MIMKEEEIILRLNKDEALVLFEFVARFNDDNHRELFHDQAEQKMMWLIAGQLEKVLAEPFMENYKERIEQARNVVRDGE
jgi:hypothetical protein